MQNMDSKQKLSLVFLIILSFIVFTGVWYGLRFDSHTEKIPFTPQQLKKIEDCQSTGDLANVAESNIVCYPHKETKRDIILLSTYPVTGGTLVRTIYEESTQQSSYTQYQEGGSFVMACDFQTGPWKLYCDKHPDKIECMHTSPPSPGSPYFVNTNYPVYKKMCDSFGYPLPRHEKIIHIVRNPIDSIEAWIHYEFGSLTSQAWVNPTVQKYVDAYGEWHSFWRDYHLKDPVLPTLWIRYEDFCLCMEPAMQKILQFTDSISHEDVDALKEIIKMNPCQEAKQVGKGLPYFSESQLAYIIEEFSFVNEHFGYSALMDEFLHHFNKPTTNSARKDYEQALWDDLEYGGRPSKDYCASLLAVEWNWENALSK